MYPSSLRNDDAVPSLVSEACLRCRARRMGALLSLAPPPACRGRVEERRRRGSEAGPAQCESNPDRSGSVMRRLLERDNETN